eukprot:m.1381363 g.1381363  ORF g.1381363 m.1381363 type:complete len:401 (-) comp24970_c0_seq26:7020-8222(-)
MSSTRKIRARSSSGHTIQLSSSFSDIRSSAEQWNDSIAPRARSRALTRKSLAAAERERSDSLCRTRTMSRHASDGHEVREAIDNSIEDTGNADYGASGTEQSTRVHGLEHLDKIHYHHSWHGKDTHLIEQWARIVAARQEAPDKYKRYVRHVGAGGGHAETTPTMPLVPPLNFAMVAPGLYRSGYPNKKNFPFLIKLGIKTVVYLGEERYLEKNKACLQGYNIRIFQFKMEGNLEPFSEISRDVLVQALECVPSDGLVSVWNACCSVALLQQIEQNVDHWVYDPVRCLWLWSRVDSWWHSVSGGERRWRRRWLYGAAHETCPCVCRWPTRATTLCWCTARRATTARGVWWAVCAAPCTGRTRPSARSTAATRAPTCAYSTSSASSSSIPRIYTYSGCPDG